MQTLHHAPLRADLDRLFTSRGTRSRLAEELGLKRSTINYWLKHGIPNKWLASATLRQAVARLLWLADTGKPLTKYGVAPP